jgi:hypothetical protein
MRLVAEAGINSDAKVGVTLSRACGDPIQVKFLQSLTADEGYFSVVEICFLQADRIRTVVGDPHAAMCHKNLPDGAVKELLIKARRAVKSPIRKALLRKRGQCSGRSVAHVLDHG